MSRMSKATASWTGKNVLVVGGTQGIGRATAIAFAKGGASVTVTGRDVGRGEALLKDLKAAAPSATMSFEAFDVTSMRNVTSFTERFRKTNEASGLHALVLCAGGLNYGPRRETAEGCFFNSLQCESV